MARVLDGEYVLRPRCDFVAGWSSGLVKVYYAETNVVTDGALMWVVSVGLVSGFLASSHDCAFCFPGRFCPQTVAPTQKSVARHIKAGAES